MTHRETINLFIFWVIDKPPSGLRGAGANLSMHWERGRLHPGQFTEKQTLQLDQEAPADLSFSETYYDFDLYCTCPVEVKCETVWPSYLIGSAPLQMAHCKDISSMVASRAVTQIIVCLNH